MIYDYLLIYLSFKLLYDNNTSIEDPSVIILLDGFINMIGFPFGTGLPNSAACSLKFWNQNQNGSFSNKSFATAVCTVNLELTIF